MADEPREIKIIGPENTGKLPRPVRRTLDVLIGLALIVTALSGFGAYFRFAVPAAGIGLVTMIVQKIINRGEPSGAVLKVSMGIRIFAALVLALLVIIMFGLLKGRSFYSLRKWLFTAGNGISSEELAFMPESLPGTCNDLFMEFDAPRWGREGSSHIGILFISDAEGAAELKKSALEKGGELCDIDSFAYKKLRVFCESSGQAIGSAEVYLLGEFKEHCPAYLVNEETGLCAVYW